MLRAFLRQSAWAWSPLAPATVAFSTMCSGFAPKTLKADLQATVSQRKGQVNKCCFRLANVGTDERLDMSAAGFGPPTYVRTYVRTTYVRTRMCVRMCVRIAFVLSSELLLHSYVGAVAKHIVCMSFALFSFRAQELNIYVYLLRAPEVGGELCAPLRCTFATVRTRTLPRALFC